MNTAKQIIETQRNNIRKVHNHRFFIGNKEFRITYVGGLTEYIAIDSRKVGDRNFKCASGFAGYKFHTAEQVINHAIKLVSEKNF